MPDPASGIFCGDGVEGWIQARGHAAAVRLRSTPILLALGGASLTRWRDRPESGERSQPGCRRRARRRPEHAHANQENRAGAWLASRAIPQSTHRSPEWIQAQIKRASVLRAQWYPRPIILGGTHQKTYETRRDNDSQQATQQPAQRGAAYRLS
jgi:hypothetical protein